MLLILNAEFTELSQHGQHFFGDIRYRLFQFAESEDFFPAKMIEDDRFDNLAKKKTDSQIYRGVPLAVGDPEIRKNLQTTVPSKNPAFKAIVRRAGPRERGTPWFLQHLLLPGHCFPPPGRGGDVPVVDRLADNRGGKPDAC